MNPLYESAMSAPITREDPPPISREEAMSWTEIALCAVVAIVGFAAVAGFVLTVWPLVVAAVRSFQ